jgi:hypothetical protein
VRSVAGGAVSVGRLLAGDPRHMTRKARQPGHRNIRIFVQINMWRGIGTSIAIFRALIIAGMIDLLEQEGYRCEIIAVSTSDHVKLKQAKAQLAVRVKDARERLSLLDIAFTLGHPSFSRRMLNVAEDVHDECVIDDSNSIVTSAFNDDHQPGSDEFYIPQLHGFQAAALTENPMSILPFIEPEGLPITIKAKER